MAAIVPKAAEIDTLTDMIAAILVGWKMRIFATNITPDANTTLAALMAAEATFAGYAAAAMTTWSAPAIDGTNAAVTTCLQGQFTATSGGGTGNMYGWFITNTAGTKLYGCERFSPTSPITQPQNLAFQVTTNYSVITRF